MCYVTFVNSLPYKAMRRLGKHTTYEFQTHVELDAPSVMCSWPYLCVYPDGRIQSIVVLVTSGITLSRIF